MGEVTLTPKGERWHRTAHPWTYRDDLAAADKALSGSVVRVKAPSGALLGQAFYNARSKIALRWLTDDVQDRVDQNFWAKRLRAAIKYREQVVAHSTAYRLISSEADGFPGLIVDRYADTLVLQSLSLGIDSFVPLLTGLLKDLLNPKSIVARNDSHMRTLEGLKEESQLLFGKPPPRIEIKEGKILYLVDVWEGHKTGAYLDQRENRLRARDFSKGRVLDAFAYQGGFSLQAASGADEVLAIEDSESSATFLKENLALNEISNVRVERANAFSRLRALEKEGEKFDLVIVDPPAFAKSKAELAGACRGYKEINLRAIRLLKAGGVLITSSCSYQIQEEIFLGVLRSASADAKRSLRLVEIRTQARDHPVVLTHPESKYLKCVVAQVAG